MPRKSIKQLESILNHKLTKEEESDEFGFTYDLLWKAGQQLLDEYGLVRSQTESYNAFINVYLPELIRELPASVATCYNESSPQFGITRIARIIGFSLDPAELFEGDESTIDHINFNNDPNQFKARNKPNTARLRNQTFASRLYFCFELTVILNPIVINEKGEKQVVLCNKVVSGSPYEAIDVRKVYEYRKPCGSIPVMKGSILDPCRNLLDQTVEDLDECPYDQGGYYIIEGSEKANVICESMVFNHTFVSDWTKSNIYHLKAEMRSSADFSLQPASICSIDMIPNTDTLEQTLMLKLTKIKDEIPIYIFFVALGVTTDKDFIETCIPENDPVLRKMLEGSLDGRLVRNLATNNIQMIKTPQEALLFIGSRFNLAQEYPTSDVESKIRYGRDVLNKELLPNVGVEPLPIENAALYRRKAINLGDMVHKLLKTWDTLRKYVKPGCKPQLASSLPKHVQHNTNNAVPDKRDDYERKRLECSGLLMAGMASQLFKKMLKEMKKRMTKQMKDGLPANLETCIEGTLITSGFKYALKTGTWSGSKTINHNSRKTGYAQSLQRVSYQGTISQLNRVHTPVESDGNVTLPRHLLPSHYAYICLAETPENQKVGLVKHLAMFCCISVGDSAYNFTDVLYTVCGLIPILSAAPHQRATYTKVKVNNNLLGVIRDGKTFVEIFRKRLRRKGIINKEVSITYHPKPHNEICINSQAGRCMRPLFVVGDDGELLVKPDDLRYLCGRPGQWNELIERGLIEMIDTEEIKNTLVAVFVDEVRSKKKKYTHMEIHPISLMGIMVGSTAFGNHTFISRLTFGAALVKGTQGRLALNTSKMFPTSFFEMHYTQKPIVSTKPLDAAFDSEMPSGTNVVVAIMMMDSNMEDAIIGNQDAFDRGLFRSTAFRSIKEAEKRLGSQLKEFFEKPNPLTTENYRVGLDPDPYEMLEEDGLGMIGSWATENHAIIGKTSQVSNLSSETKFIKKDQSIMSRPHEQGRFDKIMISDTPDGYTLVKVKMREERVPKEGDKLSSMHSQKGVMGALRRAVDMPFIASSGIVPDLVINSHALPSRMTLSQILEMVVGKACSIMGELGDGTSYEGSGDDLMEVARRVMVGCGQASSGCEVMINGETGEMYTSPVFVGVCRYLKLKNDPMEKFTCRDKGQVQLITRQPVEGRLRNGGLRFGEMEKDCVVSYGAAHLMKNIFVDNSDATKVVICKLCKLLVYEDRNGKGYCRSCNSDKVFKAIIPYTTKYLYDQLRTKNIVMRFGEKQIENVEEIELEEGQIMDDGDIAPEEPFMGISSPSEVEVY